MTYDGHVRNGAIVLDEPVALPEGLAIKIMVPISESISPTKDDAPSPTMYDILKDVIGTIEGPEDFAENHDHYIHGCPKK